MTTMQRLQRTFTGLFAAAALVLSASPAGAGKPIIIDVEDTWIATELSSCTGATIQATAVGRLIIGERGDTETLSGPWKVTYVNLDNGKSAIFNQSWHGATTETRSEDGKILTRDQCISGPLVIKDARGGVVSNESGRFCMRWVFDLSGPRPRLISREITFDVGADSDISVDDALCQILQ